MSNAAVLIKEFRLNLSDLTYSGHDLMRPEGINHRSAYWYALGL